MSLSGLRILLAEDNPTNQLVAVQMLESLGATVTLAEDGAEALEIISGATFDVGLIDIEMPRVSGIDVIRTVRTSPSAMAQMPLIALTAYVMREHRAAIDDAGADGIIAKPILSIEQFGRDIVEMMEKRAPAGRRAAATEPLDDRSVIDIGIYNGLATSIGTAAMTELLYKVEADIDRAGQRIVQAADESDADEVRAASHIMISVAGAIGAIRLEALAHCLNAAGHLPDFAIIEDKSRELAVEVRRVLEFVREQQEA